MKISCGQARDELALEVGQDLETGLGSELRLCLVDVRGRSCLGRLFFSSFEFC